MAEAIHREPCLAVVETADHHVHAPEHSQAQVGVYITMEELDSDVGVHLFDAQGVLDSLGTTPVNGRSILPGAESSGRGLEVIEDADNQSTGEKRKKANKEEDQYPGAQRGASEKRCLYACLYLDAQEAQFCFAESCQGQVDHRCRGDRIYTRYWP